jgi:hypothetical protein
MSLNAYQMALGRIIRGSRGSQREELTHFRPALSDDEYAYLLQLLDGRGLPFTIDVQRSWCKGRARDAAYMTLSLLSESAQQQLLERWIERGGGTASFFSNEAETFLEFIASYLVSHTHEMSICRMEQAVHRAARGSAENSAPPVMAVMSHDSLLAVSRYSSLVEFYCDPEQLFFSLNNNSPLPGVEKQAIMLLFAPWLPGYFRYAQKAEVSLLSSMRGMVKISELFAEGHDLQCIDALVNAGAIAIL